MKLSFLGPLVGLIGGIVGIIGGGLALCDRLVPPAVEVIEALPVYVWSIEEIRVDDKDMRFPRRGFSLIVHLRSKSRGIFVSSLEVSGNQTITLDEWSFYDATSGDSLTEIGKRYTQKKPFYRVSWTGWMDDSRVPIRLEPHEERYVRFTLVEPRAGARGRPSDKDYVGYDDGSKTPRAVRYHAV